MITIPNDVFTKYIDPLNKTGVLASSYAEYKNSFGIISIFATNIRFWKQSPNGCVSLLAPNNRDKCVNEIILCKNRRNNF